jgi:hypothetical protein
MASPKPPKRYATPPTEAQLEADQISNLEAQREEGEQDDLDNQPATPELIEALGFNPDEEWPDDT